MIKLATSRFLDERITRSIIEAAEFSLVNDDEVEFVRGQMSSAYVVARVMETTSPCNIN